MGKMNEIKESLETLVYEYCDCWECVDAHEMGEVIDMLKDMSEAVYYCTATKAMNEKYGVVENTDGTKTMDSLIDDIISMSSNMTEDEKQIIKNRIMNM